MKKIGFLFIIFLNSASSMTFCQGKGVITGAFESTNKDPSKVFLIPPSGHKIEAFVTGKKFKVRIPPGDLWVTYFLQLGDPRAGNPEDFSIPIVLNGSSETNINIDKSFRHFTISGDSLSCMQNQYFQELLKIDSPRNETERLLESTDNKINKQDLRVSLQIMNEREDSLTRSWIINHPESPFSITLIRLFVLKPRIEESKTVAFQLLYTISDNVKEQSSDYEIITSHYSDTGLEKLLKVRENTKAPDFEVEDTSGYVIRLKDFLGKYLLIDFWNTGCIPCKLSLPMLSSISKKYESKGLKVLSISLDTDRKIWKNSIKSDRMTWLQGSDLRGFSFMDKKAISFKYELSAVPQFFLISPEGKVLYRQLGYSGNPDKNQILDELNKIYSSAQKQN